MKAHSISPTSELAEVIDTATGTGGLVHVCLFLAKAFDQPAMPALEPRADIYKCAGAGLTGCATCTRMLAPTGDGQRWAKPRRWR